MKNTSDLANACDLVASMYDSDAERYMVLHYCGSHESFGHAKRAKAEAAALRARAEVIRRYTKLYEGVK